MQEMISHRSYLKKTREIINIDSIQTSILPQINDFMHMEGR
jgi:hypothetical protein